MLDPPGDLKLAAFFPEIPPKQASSSHTGAPPAIDGNLSDWPALAAVVLSTNTASNAGGTIDGSLDASTSCRFQWDDARLYVGCLVLDDFPLAPDSGSAFWHDDTLEVVFDGLNDDLWGADDHKLEIHVDGSFTDGAVASPSIQVAVAAHDVDYVVEIAVPWAMLGGPRSAGQSLGLNLGLIDDDDGGESEGWLATRRRRLLPRRPQRRRPHEPQPHEAHRPPKRLGRPRQLRRRARPTRQRRS